MLDEGNLEDKTVPHYLSLELPHHDHRHNYGQCMTTPSRTQSVSKGRESRV